jgi:hypothetical protein
LPAIVAFASRTRFTGRCRRSIRRTCATGGTGRIPDRPDSAAAQSGAGFKKTLI